MPDLLSTAASAHPLAAPLEGFWQLVHGPLAHWASVRPDHVALENETQSLTFAELHAQVIERSAAVVREQAPAMLLLNGERGTLASIVEFLAVIHSGRCAAVADPDWPAAVHERMAEWMPSAPSALQAATDKSPFYTSFTSGSTGLPKGFMRHHRSWTESFRVGLEDFGPVAAERMLSPGRMSHSLFLFGVMQALWCGSGAIVQERFSALRCLHTLSDAEVPCLVAVPSQLLLMLQWAAQRALPPIERVRFIMISGARWMRSQTPALQALFPNARIVEFYGASEASFIAWMDADADTPAQAVGRPFSNVQLSIRPVQTQDHSDDDPTNETDTDIDSGLIYIRSPMLFIDYVGENIDRTGVLRDGEWLSVRDMGHVDASGLLHLAGRQSRMIVTRGKNLFPEELENLLQEHPAIQRASVLGVPDVLRGMQLHAVIQWRETAIHNAALTQWLRERTESFKLPRQWWMAREWPQTTSGKTDHSKLAQAVRHALFEDASSTHNGVTVTPWNG